MLTLFNSVILFREFDTADLPLRIGCANLLCKSVPQSDFANWLVDIAGGSDYDSDCGSVDDSAGGFAGGSVVKENA